MRFLFVTHDPDFKIGLATQCINGGTAPQWHLTHTLQAMGHQAEIVNMNDIMRGYDFDYIFIQSEWYSCVQEQLADLRRAGVKLIVWLGHFKAHHYFDPVQIQADFYVTTWQGEILKSVPYSDRVLYWPHAYCDVCDQDTEVPHSQMIWFGNKYPLRDESWLNGLPVTSLNAIMPNLLGSYYRRAVICPNLHGDFQKGIVSHHDASIADLPGYALNERIFATCGSGGFQVCDWSPLIDATYSDDEVVKCKSAAQFAEACHTFLRNPHLRLPHIERAKAKTLAMHTYKHRINELFKHIGL